MATVIMGVSVSGSRDGRDWPPAGSTLDVDDAEAKELHDAGIARIVVAAVKRDVPGVEAAVTPANVETATVNAKPTRRTREPATSKTGGDW